MQKGPVRWVRQLDALMEMTTMIESFQQLFEQATGFAPYPYQVRMATGSELPSRMSVPTGIGKTAAAVLGWLWRRRYATPDIRNSTPRRLVYCLPMRVLVEQTRDCTVRWLQNLDLLAGGLSQNGIYDPWNTSDNPSRIGVHMLLGGDVDRDWDRFPERDAILIGTQDMLLSRAMNRGYAMSRYRWPVQFALLNNDACWVLDEVQLMGSGLATTTQMQAFRRMLGTARQVRSVWMSATISGDWLKTVDYDERVDAPTDLCLTDEDLDHPAVATRINARKPIEKAPCSFSTNGKEEAPFIIDAHRPGTLTLVIVNTVKRARALYDAIRRNKPSADLLLIHSRFRPPERQAAINALLASPGDAGTIAVTTQVVEAGVDISSATLITDLAPWASLVQRFGRCNRAGDIQDARVYWLAPPDLDDAKKLRAAPYDPLDLQSAATQLEVLTDVGSSALPDISASQPVRNVLRQRDLIELFDTTPDIAGADIDVSRFIRETDAHDVQVFWREVPKSGPESTEPGPHRDELCPVPVGEIDLRKRSAWRWDHLDKCWTRPSVLVPGLVLLLPTNEGGYGPIRGWDGKTKTTKSLHLPAVQLEADSDDPDTVKRPWETLAEHTDRVVDELSSLVNSLELPEDGWTEALQLAARWHDVGKAHQVFQESLLGEPPDAPTGRIWAKAKSMARYKRPGFRHELASALAMLDHGLPDLAAYLAAAHHGKIRLSLRSLPHEKHPNDPAVRFARGVWDGDPLPSADLGGGEKLPEMTLDLGYVELGEGPKGPSWLARTLALRDDPLLGPFRLAFLEALLRVADWRGSESKEKNHG